MFPKDQKSGESAIPGRSIRDYLTVCIVLIVCIVLFLVLTVSYIQASTDAVRQYDMLREYTEVNGVASVRLVNTGLGIIDDDLNPQMKQGLLEFLEAYERAGGDPAIIDLALIRDNLSGEGIGGEVDLYIIDADGIIRYATVPGVVGVDFRQYPAFYAALTSILEGDGFAADRVVRSIEDMGDLNVSGGLRKFAYLPTPDHRYVLEMGVESDEFTEVRSLFSFSDAARQLLENNPDLLQVQIVDIYGNIVAGEGAGEIAGPDVMAAIADRASSAIEDQSAGTTSRLVFIDLREPAAVTDNSVVLRLVFDHAHIDAVGQQLLITYALIGYMAAILGIGLSLVLSRYIASSIGAVIEDADRIAGGDLDHAVRSMNTTEFIRLGESINTMVSRIREYSEDIERSESELRIAAGIQSSLLPREIPQPRGCEIYAFTQPAKEVGGDFFDFFGQGEGRYALIIADVAGKGVPAALFMALSRTTVRTIARWCRTASEIIRRSNDAVIEDSGSVSFVTLFYGMFDEREKTLTYVNAGHNPPIIRRSSGMTEALEPTGPVVGFLEEMMYDEVTVSLAPGDLLVLYTDGVTESQDNEGILFGEERLHEIIDSAAACSAREVAERIRDAAIGFAGDAPQFDDITVIVLRMRDAGVTDGSAATHRPER